MPKCRHQPAGILAGQPLETPLHPTTEATLALAYLEEARALGAALVVAVNSDASVRRLGKGADRPLNFEDDRMVVLAALAAVDLVVPFDDDTPRDLIVAAMPDVLVKGGDYTAETTAGAAEVLAHGGRFVAIPFAFDRSTSALVARIRRG